ncbi:MAG: butyrate kinase [bacterium]
MQLKTKADPGKLLVINVGSTSVKLALFSDAQQTAATEAAFDHALAGAPAVAAVVAAARAFLHGAGVDPDSLRAIAARGGLLRPLAGGTYRVNAAMLQDLAAATYGRHASNFSALAAAELARRAGTPAYIVDPVTVDELADEAAITGIPAIRRRSIFHALSQKAAARRAAAELGKRYEESSLIVAHLGGGISVAAHQHGRVIDVNNALDGDGPLAPERAGTIPAGSLAELCLSGKHTLPEIKRMLAGHGGMSAHLGTDDMRQVEQRIQAGDARAALLTRAMALAIARQIGAMAAVLSGRVDAIVLTGALVQWLRLRDLLHPRIAFLGPVLIYAENMEMAALAQGVQRVLTGAEHAQDY